METKVEQVRNQLGGEIDGDSLVHAPKLLHLAADIAQDAIFVYADELREKALNIAKAVADFSTALERLV